MASRTRTALAPVEHIAHSILVLRGQKVLLAELVDLYGVTTERLNEQIKRNAERFPEDFLFHFTWAEIEALNRDPRFPPYAFTEHWAIMASMVLNSFHGLDVYVVRAFVQLRELFSSNRKLARRLAQLETRLVKKPTEHDQAIAAILYAIREPMNPPPPKRRPMCFTADLEEKS